MKKLKKSLEKKNDNIAMTIKQEKLVNRIVELEENYEYQTMTMQATQLMLNFAKWQVDVYQRMTGTRDEDLSCNQDCPCEN